jgi:two-component system, response regulator
MRTMTGKCRAILLAEDNPDDVALTQRALAKAKVANELAVVSNGQEALDYLFGEGAYAETKPPSPCLVLLDLNMPKIGGLEVLKRIRSDERTRLIPTVILTTSKEERDLVAGYSLGANSYIRKPVDFAQFAEAIQQLGLYWLVLNETPPLAGDHG